MARRAVQKAEEPHPVWGNDPAKYDGPLRRMDGQRPFNNHFWPTTWYRIRHYDEILGNRVSCARIWRDNIGVCQLNTGEWLNSSGGFTYSPRYPTRKAAMEAAAADVLSDARSAMLRTKGEYGYGGYYPISAELYAAIVRWVAWVLTQDAAEHGDA